MLEPTIPPPMSTTSAVCMCAAIVNGRAHVGTGLCPVPAGRSPPPHQLLFQRRWFQCRPGLLLPPHLLGQFPDLGQVALHLAPSVPERVIRTAVERALER